jgi:hypothetical protein
MALVAITISVISIVLNIVILVGALSVAKDR